MIEILEKLEILTEKAKSSKATFIDMQNLQQLITDTDTLLPFDEKQRSQKALEQLQVQIETVGCLRSLLQHIAGSHVPTLGFFFEPVLFKMSCF